MWAPNLPMLFAMTEVDVVRLLASENNLEFVDLDLYSVDPAVASVLPASVARQNHVVPIGRKFGAPVVAIADPGDMVAMDNLRAAIGREFITVVASSDQIDTCLTRVYNGAPTPAAPPPVAAAPPAPPVAPLPPVTVEPTSASLSSAPSGAPIGAQNLVVDPSPVPSSSAAVAAPMVQTPASPMGEAPGLPSSASDTAATDDVLAAALTDVVLPTAAAESAIIDESEVGAPMATTVPPPVSMSPPSGDSGSDDLTDVEVALAEFVEGGPAGEAPTELTGETSSFPPLARVLVEGGRVSLDDMRAVLRERERTGQAIARILTVQGLVTEADLMWGMAQEMGLAFVDLDVQTVDFASAYHLPEATARHHNVLVMGIEDGIPIVAASNPTDVFAMDDLRTIIGRNFVTVVATRSQINSYIDKAYNQGGSATEFAASAASDIGAEQSEEELGNLQAVVDDAPIVRYVNLLILQALNERASDIHVEPNADNLRIRYRIDGVLHDTSTAPRAIASAVTTRLKVMADMNIAEHRLPQDGRISLTVGSRQIDLRMATLPTIYGEKIVMRVLDKTNVVLGFDDLGFDDDLLAVYRKVFTKPYGTILVTGPTGCGKTTTLYATLAALNSPDKNIITVEDPVELRIKGINQVQLNVKAGLTFAAALRSILRADPDILLVGEIRDRETATVAVEAALTGHLVLSTLHTNDSASTPMRLVEMGLEPYLVTTAISAALAQRLARRLCQHCREPYEPTEAELAVGGWNPGEVLVGNGNPTLYRAVGCPACSKTGYRGRKALLELLVVTEEVERLIIEGGTADDIHKLAVEQGMVTLRRSGLRKALEGETTLEEVLRVVA